VGTISSLLFLGMDETTGTRSFEDAYLRFEDRGGELRWHGGRAITLTVDTHKVLRAAMQWLVHEHAS
jgi:hypothetical protein